MQAQGRSVPFFDRPPAMKVAGYPSARPRHAAAGIPKPDGDNDWPGVVPDEAVEPDGDTYDPSLPSTDVPPNEETPGQPVRTPGEAPLPPD